jgi:hypothetical protein
MTARRAASRRICTLGASRGWGWRLGELPVRAAAGCACANGHGEGAMRALTDTAKAPCVR